MLIFWRLVLAHLISDFTLQLNVVNRLKRSVWWGMAVHVGTHLALSLALVWPYLGDVWFKAGPLRLSGWECLAAIMVLHWLQDYWRIFAIRKFNTADGTIHFLWDQFIHLGTLFVFSPLFGFQQSGSFVPEKWAALCAIFVLVTHFTTVLVYFIEKDFYKEEFPAIAEKGPQNRRPAWLRLRSGVYPGGVERH